MSEDLEEKCIQCEECHGRGEWLCIDLTEEEPNGFRIICEVCRGHKCFSIKMLEINRTKYNISSEPYRGECNGHCGFFRDEESYLKSLENK